ncbi:MAG: alpha/beta hydrolase [Marinilabiliales bacterium]|nr:MAG: alpha/beta hydrolase [Marinilabiliales bacterium]
MELFYRKYGNGKPVVILHGLYGLSDNWAWYGRRLGEKYSVFTPDLRNHGLSPHDNGMNYYAMVSDLEEFMEFHNIAKPVLIGHSMGGKVVLQYLKENPGEASAAIIMDISPKKYRANQSHMNILGTMSSLDLTSITSRKEISEKVKEKIDDERLQNFVLKNLNRTGKELFTWKPNVQVLETALEDIFDEITPPVNKPGIPVQFIKGELSQYIKDDDEDIIEKFWSDRPIISVPGASHWLHADNPEYLINVLEQFLKEVF